eukprot:2475958-Pyramimonas_sp.AAC.1
MGDGRTAAFGVSKQGPAWQCASTPGATIRLGSIQGFTLCCSFLLLSRCGFGLTTPTLPFLEAFR